MEKDDRLTSLECFAAVGRRLSFVKAAEDLGLTASAVSHRVANLERKLDIRLFNRTTRSVTFTEPGRAYFESVVAALDQLDVAQDALVAFRGGEPAGRLKVALPTTFGQLYVAPVLPAFMKKYPKVKLDLSFSDAMVDLVADGFDVGIRIGNLGKNDYASRKLAPNVRVLCAAPGFVKANAPLLQPRDLENVPALHISTMSPINRWTLQSGQRVVEVKVQPVMRSDYAVALCLAAKAGLGVTLMAQFLVQDDLKSGKLVRVLPKWSGPGSWVWAIYPNRRQLPAKVRAFVDFMAEHLRLRLGQS